MLTENLSIKKLGIDERNNFLNCLLLADENEMIVREYLCKGEMFAIYYLDTLAGTVLFVFHPGYKVEIKNFALLPDFRGKGFGQFIIRYFFDLYKERGYKQVIVGTANSSISNIAFYQKAGFRISHMMKDYFLKYPEPILENGIQAQDMIMFRKDLEFS